MKKKKTKKATLILDIKRFVNPCDCIGQGNVDGRTGNKMQIIGQSNNNS